MSAMTDDVLSEGSARHVVAEPGFALDHDVRHCFTAYLLRVW